MAFHRRLSAEPVIVALPIGLGIADFNKPGRIRLIEAYRRKHKHADAHAIADAFARYTNFPSTFDGSLPSEAFGSGAMRSTIGETYHFDDIDGQSLIATVSSATVNEPEKRIYLGITDMAGTITHLASSMPSANSGTAAGRQMQVLSPWRPAQGPAHSSSTGLAHDEGLFLAGSVTILSPNRLLILAGGACACVRETRYEIPSQQALDCNPWP